MHGMHGVTGSNPVSSTRYIKTMCRGVMKRGFMKKRYLAPYLIVLIPWTTIASLFSIYQVYKHGVGMGLFLVLLTWSGYVLCVPAAHGRILIGAPLKLIFNRSFLPEPFFWIVAALINACTLFFAPGLYEESIFTYLLYRIFITPDYWLILLVGALGSWYRFLVGLVHYRAREATHTLIRHIIFLVGIFLLFYLTHYEFIILMNTTASG
jgi:hypothetical protein